MAPVTASTNLSCKSSNREDYLKAVYKLTQEAESEFCRIKDIAGLLSVSAPSVSEMVKILTREGSIDRIPYKGVKLTRKGARIARNLVKKHRILERFIYDVLGLKHGFHKEAHRLEHAASGKLVERINELLNYPKECPKGDPIPQSNKHTHHKRAGSVTALTELKEGEHARISFILGGQGARCRLAELGLVSGTRIKVERMRALRSGPIELEVRGSHLAIGHGIASKVFVVNPQRRGRASRAVRSTQEG